MMRQPKIVKIKYEVVVATFNQEGLIQAQDQLYSLFDEVLYNSVSDVAGVDFLVDTTELRMDGETG
jgi:hypothetical protein